MQKTLARTLVLALVAAALAAALAAAPASAHVTVTATSPAKSGTAKKTLKRVRVTFSAPIRSGTLKVYRKKNGSKVSIGNGQRDPRNLKRLVVSLKGGLKTGKYVARWTCAASDGHQQSGSFGFRLVS